MRNEFNFTDEAPCGGQRGRSETKAVFGFQSRQANALRKNPLSIRTPFETIETTVICIWVLWISPSGIICPLDKIEKSYSTHVKHSFNLRPGCSFKSGLMHDMGCVILHGLWLQINLNVPSPPWFLEIKWQSWAHREEESAVWRPRIDIEYLWDTRKWCRSSSAA